MQQWNYIIRRTEESYASMAWLVSQNCRVHGLSYGKWEHWNEYRETEVVFSGEYTVIKIWEQQKYKWKYGYIQKFLLVN